MKILNIRLKEVALLCSKPTKLVVLQEQFCYEIRFHLLDCLREIIQNRSMGSTFP